MIDATELAKELGELARPVARRYSWVTKGWAFEHFGSQMEADFVALASPKNVLALPTLLEQLSSERDAALLATEQAREERNRDLLDPEVDRGDAQHQAGAQAGERAALLHTCDNPCSSPIGAIILRALGTGDLTR